MDLIDTHCHPHFNDFFPDPAAMISRAKEAGVSGIIAVGVDLEDSRQAVKFAEKYPDAWAAAGIHPYEALSVNEQTINELKKILNMSSIVAIGEIGLDYHRPGTNRQAQQGALREQIKAFKNLNLPFIFHVRDAWADFWQILDENENLKGVIHSFTGGPKQLEQALKRGLHIALNGIVTFTADEAVLEAAKKVPLDKLILETDSPFLTPKGANEEICEPKHLKVTAEFLAKLRGESLEKISSATTTNAIKLFGLKQS